MVGSTTTGLADAAALAALGGPPGLPLLGNLHQLKAERLHAVLETWADRYGPRYRFRLGTRDALVLSGVDVAHTVLRQRPDGYRRLHTIEAVLAEMGITGVFSAEGDAWRRLRRLAVQGLNPEYLRQYFDTVARVTAALHARWTRAAGTGVDVDVQQDLMRYTLDVTASLSLGYALNTVTDDADPLQGRLRRIFPMINRRVNAPFPYWRYVTLPDDRRVDTALREIGATVRGIVRSARIRCATLTRPPADMLEAMLVRREGTAPFTDAEIIGNMITMLLAGQETTASTMAWIVHCVTERPDIQHRMRDEADRVLGSAETVADFDLAGRLPYIEAVITETMRVRPIAPMLFLEPNQDTVIAGLRVPRGTPIFLLTMYHARRDEHFADSTVFDPDRWLPDGQAVPRTPHDTRAFLPFGAGPRRCPGHHLAMLEAKMVMAMAVRNFAITRPPGARPCGERFAFTLQPVDLTVRFAARPR